MSMTMIGLDDFLGAVRNFGQVSGWSFVTSGSVSAEYGWEVGINVGAGGEAGYFHVTSDKHTADVYTCEYALATGSAGLGASLFGVASISIGPEEMPSWGTRFARLIGAPDASGETGPPTGFGGQCLMVSVALGVGNQGWVTFAFLGYNRSLGEKLGLIPGLIPELNPVCYKYGGISLGAAITSSASVSITGKLGAVHSIRNVKTGQRISF
ncbi:MAG: hypothetical protein U0359_22785 [Byssovorax sp.]